MEQKPAPVAPGTTIITREAVASQLEACMAGTLTTKALAAWAFDRFYAEELGTEQYELGAEAMLADVLDALMFGDDPGFRLDQEELRGLSAQLRTV